MEKEGNQVKSKFDIAPEILEYKLKRLIGELENEGSLCRKYGQNTESLVFSKCIYRIKEEFNL